MLSFILIFPYHSLVRVFQIKFLVERHLQSPYAIAKGNSPNKMRLLAVCLMLIHIAVSQPPDYYWPSVPVLLSQSPPVDKSVLTRETLRLSSLLDKNLKEQKILGETSAAARKEHAQTMNQLLKEMTVLAERSRDIQTQANALAREMRDLDRDFEDRRRIKAREMTTIVTNVRDLLSKVENN